MFKEAISRLRFLFLNGMTFIYGRSMNLSRQLNVWKICSLVSGKMVILSGKMIYLSDQEDYLCGSVIAADWAGPIAGSIEKYVRGKPSWRKILKQIWRNRMVLSDIAAE